MRISMPAKMGHGSRPENRSSQSVTIGTACRIQVGRNSDGGRGRSRNSPAAVGKAAQGDGAKLPPYERVQIYGERPDGDVRPAERAWGQTHQTSGRRARFWPRGVFEALCERQRIDSRLSARKRGQGRLVVDSAAAGRRAGRSGAKSLADV